jgi:tetratricopeptide (TPR) repeat protein
MQKTLITMLVLVSFVAAGHAQEGRSAGLLREGTALHDQRDYEGALRKYDDIIAGDKDFLAAYYEKSFTLFAMGRYQDCIDLCKSILKQFPRENTQSVYVNYGSALDQLGRNKEAISVYRDGIKKYPNFYLLHFNKGITEFNDKSSDDALADFERSVTLNPQHPSSHLYLAYCMADRNKIAALLAFTAFLLLEPEGARAKKNLPTLLNILGAGVTQDGEKHITISLSPDALGGKSKGEDDFTSAQLMISMRSALDYDDKYKALPRAINLKDKLELLADMTGIKTGKKAGFFTNFYMPLLRRMKSDSVLETACYIMLSSSDDPVNRQWLGDHQDKVKAFTDWLSEYPWSKEAIK